MLCFCACGKVPTNSDDGSFDHFVGDFENANLKGFYFLVPDTTVNTVVVNDPVRKGNFALRNTLRPDDYINNGYRAELAVYNCANYHSDVYYGFSMMIDSAYTDMQYNLLCQWQDLPYYQQGEVWESSPVLHGSPPPIALVYVNGSLELKFNDKPSSDEHTYTVGSPQQISKGVWYDLVFHMYWSDKDDAYVEAWINNTHITPYNGSDFKYYHSNLFNRSGNYFKFGQYRGKDNTEHNNTVYFDEIKIGSDYSEVAP